MPSSHMPIFLTGYKSQLYIISAFAVYTYFILKYSNINQMRCIILPTNMGQRIFIYLLIYAALKLTKDKIILVYIFLLFLTSHFIGTEVWAGLIYMHLVALSTRWQNSPCPEALVAIRRTAWLVVAELNTRKPVSTIYRRFLLPHHKQQKLLEYTPSI